MKTPKEYALKLCQEIGGTTMFSECNGGYTLPLEISQKIAHICVNEIIDELDTCERDIKNERLEYFKEVKTQIDLI